MSKRAVRSLTDRFWDKIDVRGPDECWPWIAGRHNAGYGTIRARHKKTDEWCSRPAHQVAYEIQNGPIPEGKYVLHTCDNRPCCNGRHLYIGTAERNIRDAVERRRAHFVVNNPNRKLTEDAVKTIRAQVAGGARKTDVARAHGITYWAVYRIVKGERWAHI